MYVFKHSSSRQVLSSIYPATLIPPPAKKKKHFSFNWILNELKILLYQLTIVFAIIHSNEATLMWHRRTLHSQLSIIPNCFPECHKWNLYLIQEWTEKSFFLAWYFRSTSYIKSATNFAFYNDHCLLLTGAAFCILLLNRFHTKPSRYYSYKDDCSK